MHTQPWALQTSEITKCTKTDLGLAGRGAQDGLCAVAHPVQVVLAHLSFVLRLYLIWCVVARLGRSAATPLAGRQVEIIPGFWW